jgi:hypothetical protein
VFADPKRGAISFRRAHLIRMLDNGRAHVAFVGADGSPSGSSDVPAECVYVTRDGALNALAAKTEDWPTDAVFAPPPCPHCDRERLLSTNLRLDVLRAAGMPPGDVDRAKASMERGEW